MKEDESPCSLMPDDQTSNHTDSAPETSKENTRSVNPEVDLLLGARNTPGGLNKEVANFFHQITQMQINQPSFPGRNITDKLLPEHFTYLLEGAQKDADNEFKQRTAQRQYNFAIFVITVFAAFGTLWLLSPNHKDLLIDLIKIFAGLGGGFGLGYGYKTRFPKK